MANTRTFPASTAATATPIPLNRHRLRAVDRDEVAPPVDPSSFLPPLPPGATWLPAPQHTLPSLPGQPPMIGYLVLLPADQQPEPEPVAAEAATAGRQLVRIDSAQRIAEVDGHALDLTYLEFELLAHLVAHPHRVHTRDQLVTTVWGYGHVGDGRTVDVHVARLRRKLGAEHRHSIQTVRRVGYKYAP
ncbi:winged helix-turn-helix domain-containing protein [Streptomyces beijiangensis]|uniref:Winged helix-turn-helix transcriptional regulator n=1 Tax=Streptomyces beijiangensis TaxID=163361 RepID=A0A939F738_9ACTN|nr:winged helix-turn-helix domain-containing protein [Streptomyces beijiangensis]MBO0512904.1 winged helix-turn-helix transcriptional regulator [Streptomyces beijiangensis]